MGPKESQRFAPLTAVPMKRVLSKRSSSGIAKRIDVRLRLSGDRCDVAKKTKAPKIKNAQWRLMKKNGDRLYVSATAGEAAVTSKVPIAAKIKIRKVLNQSVVHSQFPQKVWLVRENEKSQLRFCMKLDSYVTFRGLGNTIPCSTCLGPAPMDWMQGAK